MKPLEGILVVSVEQAVAAPLCSARLADAGARVIKIERAGGDFARGYDRAAKGASSYFTWINQGKESAVLDIKDAADQALLRAMIGRADVFIQNLAPGALAKLGLGSATLRTAHPRLVTCDISGYGEGDAVAGLKAYDLLIQAESGLIATSGGPGEMGRIGVSLCDIGAGVTAHAAILEALLRRANTGDGASLQISLFDVAAEWMAVPLIHQDYGAGAPAREGLRHPSIAPYGGYVCGDGRTVIISIQNEREWRRLCVTALDAPGLADDPRFISNALRVEHRDALDDA
ncbi:MAG: CaiB/BaiF CoA-transferase family protein, partial [Pseudomonadota bacterium]